MEMSYMLVDRSLVFMVWMESHIDGLGRRRKRGNLALYKLKQMLRLFLMHSLIIVILMQRSDSNWECHTCTLIGHWY